VDKQRFLVARLSLEAATANADWIADDTHECYDEIDPIDFEQEAKRVFELYLRTYSDLGPPFVTEADQLFKYNRWVLFYADGSTAASDIIACALFDVTDCGIKGRLKASDLSSAGRLATKDFAIASYNAPKVFGEVSGRLERAISDRVRIVDFARAKRVMKRLGHDIEPVKSGPHYERTIHGERVQKLMVGDPIVPNDDDPPQGTSVVPTLR
jgi:hypothetical protein